MSKYDVSGNIEAEFEPGSNNLVLKNKLGIKDKQQMDEVEYGLLKQMETWAIQNTTQSNKLTSKGICQLHRVWLSSVFSWAGEYRSVEIGKGGFQFATARVIPNLMEEFDQKILSRFTPMNYSDVNECASALAAVHVEFILIHPFREGNGRMSRVISDLMALQAGSPPLNYETLTDSKKYISAIHAGLDRNYKPMKDLFLEIIKKSQHASPKA